MLQTVNQKVEKCKQMDFQEFINHLKAINENRIRAYSYYPLHTSQEKWDAMALLRIELKHAQTLDNPKMIARSLLRLEIHFVKLTPSITSKLRNTYIQKINVAMGALREFLQLQKQRN